MYVHNNITEILLTVSIFIILQLDYSDGLTQTCQQRSSMFYILCINIYCSFSALFIVFDIYFLYIKMCSAHMDTNVFAQTDSPSDSVLVRSGEA